MCVAEVDAVLQFKFRMKHSTAMEPVDPIMHLLFHLNLQGFQHLQTQHDPERLCCDVLMLLHVSDDKQYFAEIYEQPLGFFSKQSATYWVQQEQRYQSEKTGKMWITIIYYYSSSLIYFCAIRYL